MEENKTLEMNTESVESKNELDITETDQSRPVAYEEESSGGFAGVILGAAAIGAAVLIGRKIYKKVRNRKKPEEATEEFVDDLDETVVDVDAEEVDDQEEPEESE